MRQQKWLCFLCNHKNLLDQTRKRWGENSVRTHRCLAQKASSPEFCFSSLLAVQPKLIHSQCSAKTVLTYRNILLLHHYSGSHWSHRSAQLQPCPTPTPPPSISTTAFVGCGGKPLLDEQRSGWAHKTEPFNCSIFLTCRTTLGGVNKSHLSFVLLQLKRSVFHQNYKCDRDTCSGLMKGGKGSSLDLATLRHKADMRKRKNNFLRG